MPPLLYLSAATQAVKEAVSAFIHKVEAIEEHCRELEGKVRAQKEALNKAQKVEEERDLLKRLPAIKGEGKRRRRREGSDTKARSRLNGS